MTGALKALDYGLGPVPAALMGMVTGIGGGMARDVLAGRVPVVFRGELYATPALAGCLRSPSCSHADGRPFWSPPSGAAWRPAVCLVLAAARDPPPDWRAAAARPGPAQTS